jgi:splicing factor 1
MSSLLLSFNLTLETCLLFSLWEQETGAKVQIFGTKTGGEKVELSPSDENEIQKSWQELYFQISSDTYEKVDAAIAVVELLMSSVSVSS